MTKTKDIICLVINLLIAPVCVGLSILGCFRLYQRRNELFIQKRNVTVLSISLIFIFLFEIGSFIISILFIILKNDLLLVGTAFFHVLLCCVFIALIPINYLKFYLYNFNNAIKKHEWTSIIVGNKADDNWFIKHKQTFGEWRYIGKYIIILIVINFCCSITGNFIAITNVLKSNTLFFIIGSCIAIPFTNVAIIALVLIIKFTPYDKKDSFYFKGEQRLHLKVFILLSVVLVISGVHIGVGIPLKEPILVITIDICVYYGLALGVTGCGLILSSTFGVLYNNTKHNDSHSDSSVELHLDEVLRNEKELNNFMEHVISELSVELVTAYIEINQYLSYISSEMNLDQTDFDRFYSSIPLSEIVHGNKKDTIFNYFNQYNLCDETILIKIKGYMLYCKYIQEFSTFQINIPYCQRNKFDVLMGDSIHDWLNVNITINEIYSLFKTPLKELKKLIKFSFFRYKKK